MPSRQHQSLLTLLAECPELVIELVRLCSGIDVPSELELLPGPDTVRLPTSDRIADGALVVRRRSDGTNQEAFVIEAQLRRDARKRRSWPIYVAGTAARLGCPTTLVVVTSSEQVARWAATPIDVGRGRMMLTPLVIGPRQIPTTLSLDHARVRPDMLALIVITHGQGGSLRLSWIAIRVARELLASGDRRSMVLADLIAGAIPEGVRRTVEAEMDAVTGWGKTIYFSEIGKAVCDGWAAGRRAGRAEGKAAGRAKGKAEGRAKGLAKALLTVLETRGLGLTAAQRARIRRCRSIEQLEAWLRQAVLASDPSEIFAITTAGTS